MSDFENAKTKSGFSMKLSRGERMCLVGFDVKTPEPDLVGFAIESKAPKTKVFEPLKNRIAFDSPGAVVDGKRKFLSTEAPFQKFRWVHFPFNPQKGIYTYRATKMHMPKDGKLKQGTSINLDISLDPVTYDKFLDVGFTRGFASSQAFLDRVPQGQTPDEFGKSVIPSRGDEGLAFKKLKSNIYSWMGFEAHDLIFGLLDEALKDKTITLDVFAYDLNEPDLLAALEKLGKRVRAIVDDSSKKVDGVVKGHGAADSPESQAADRLMASAGSDNVRRTHFRGLQHHKVIVMKKGGKAIKVLTGSTNFSFRGLYIQANNAMLFHSADVADLYARVFQSAFENPSEFSKDELANKWHLVQSTGKPAVRVCFSPHDSSDLSLNPVKGAVDQATSSVFYSVAFLNLIKSGPTKEAFDRLIQRPIFSYGVCDVAGKAMEVQKPDGTTGLVDFSFLAAKAPEPFKSEWSGGKGINVHHKFVVTDFNLPTAKVFTGSSNLSPGGEEGNGDHLIMVEDRKIATSYAIEALRMFDHLHFRSNMQSAEQTVTKIALRKPTAISSKPAWFEDYYKPDTQRERDRKLFGN